MMLVFLRILCLIIGYGFGLIQAGFLIGRIYNIDIRKKGSGNSGTTNAMRVLGVKAGLATFFIDALKCVVAILLVRLIWGGDEAFMLLAVYTGLGVTLGHNFPFYMNYKGGKGIAAMSGLVIILGVLTSPWILIVPAFAFFSCAILTRFVSLGSLQVSVLFLFMMVFYGQMGGFEYLTDEYRMELYIVVFVLAALAWFRHLDNIKRLFKGEENRFGTKNPEDENEALENERAKESYDWENDDSEEDVKFTYKAPPKFTFTPRTSGRTIVEEKEEEYYGEEVDSKIENLKEKLSSLKGRFRSNRPERKIYVDDYDDGFGDDYDDDDDDGFGDGFEIKFDDEED